MLLLRIMPKIEAAFGAIKELLLFAVSLLRSVKGYSVHCLRVLLGHARCR